MKPRTSCGIGAFHTGENDCRCSGEGPCSRRAARWRGVQYPLFEARWYIGKTGSQAEIMRSRSTLAMMAAAAMERESASPWMIGCCGISQSSRTASIKKKIGRRGGLVATHAKEGREDSERNT